MIIFKEVSMIAAPAEAVCSGIHNHRPQTTAAGLFCQITEETPMTENKNIPKIIHYFWFGNGEMSRLNKKCIESWKNNCPEFKIMRWDESNFDISVNRFAREAYEAHQWGFVTDYVRLCVLYKYGGIQLDTDVEVLKSYADLCKYEGFIGFEEANKVNDGQGFGIRPGHPIVKEFLEYYEDRPFVLEDGSYDRKPSPYIRTEGLVKHGLKLNGTRQNIEGIEILPKDFLCPKDFLSKKTMITPNTYSIHHFNASWYSPKERIGMNLLHSLCRILGNQRGVRAYAILRHLAKR